MRNCQVRNIVDILHEYVTTFAHFFHLDKLHGKCEGRTHGVVVQDFRAASLNIYDICEQPLKFF